MGPAKDGYKEFKDKGTKHLDLVNEDMTTNHGQLVLETGFLCGSSWKMTTGGHPSTLELLTHLTLNLDCSHHV